MRVISASIFLLKALSLGTSNSDLEASLDLLDECICALQNKQRIDEMHLGNRYGTLLARHVKRFRNSFVGPFRPNSMPGAIYEQRLKGTSLRGEEDSETGTIHAGSSILLDSRIQPPDTGGFNSHSNFEESIGFTDNWLAQPFDPSIAPFGSSGPQFQSGFEIGSLDFLWNLSN